MQHFWPFNSSPLILYHYKLNGHCIQLWSRNKLTSGFELSSCWCRALSTRPLQWPKCGVACRLHIAPKALHKGQAIFNYPFHSYHMTFELDIKEMSGWQLNFLMVIERQAEKAVIVHMLSSTIVYQRFWSHCWSLTVVCCQMHWWKEQTIVTFLIGAFPLCLWAGSECLWGFDMHCATLQPCDEGTE